MPHFAKRHYEAIATVMQNCKPRPIPLFNEAGQWYTTVYHLSEMLARDNPQFKRDRFERACEPGANVRARTR